MNVRCNSKYLCVCVRVCMCMRVWVCYVTLPSKLSERIYVRFSLSLSLPPLSLSCHFLSLFCRFSNIYIMDKHFTKIVDKVIILKLLWMFIDEFRSFFSRDKKTTFNWSTTPFPPKYHSTGWSQGGRGHWTLNYTGTQSFIKTFSHW